jgi:TPR repeat protein
MHQPWLCSYLLLTAVCAAPFPSFAQSAADSSAPAGESSPDELVPPPAPTLEEQVLPDLLPEEQADPLLLLGELRGAVRTDPDRVEDRFKLAQALYQIGDLDAALDECRAALALAPETAKGHVQLGVLLMAKQEWRNAAAAMNEAVRLDSDLVHAHYALGTIHYSLGNPKAAIAAYRRAIELQAYFPDARYRLALVLKLTNQHQEAAQFMEEAAQGGVAQAQYFLGNAYRQGQGVRKDLARAIYWWTRASEFGQVRAAEVLSHLRRQALARDEQDRRRAEARDAFRRYRDGLWELYPGRDHRDTDASLGVTLLAEGRSAEALPILLAEAYALSGPAHDAVMRLYEHGDEDRVRAFDPRLRRCLETLASDGVPAAKKAAARIYGLGLGVSHDVQKAKAFLKGLPKQEVAALMDEISSSQRVTP